MARKQSSEIMVFVRTYQPTQLRPQSAATSVRTLNIEYLYLYRNYLTQELISQFNTCVNNIHFSVTYVSSEEVRFIPLRFVTL